VSRALALNEQQRVASTIGGRVRIPPGDGVSMSPGQILELALLVLVEAHVAEELDWPCVTRRVRAGPARRARSAAVARSDRARVERGARQMPKGKAGRRGQAAGLLESAVGLQGPRSRAVSRAGFWVRCRRRSARSIAFCARRQSRCCSRCSRRFGSGPSALVGSVMLYCVR
jgi:hypothetical protein